MNKQRQCNTQATQHQRGAVAIIVALCLVVLVGMLGLVLDLGHLYVAKTELQNAADAAALSGAKELDGSLAGVNSAKDRAIEAAGKNKYDLNAIAVTIDEANLEFSSSPDGPWVSVAAAQASPADKTFLKVDTGIGGTDLQSFNTWFIHVLPGAPDSTATFGMAVAGRYQIHVTPMGVCAIDKTRPEYGFLRGVAYNIPNLNPLANGDPIWINPIDSAPGPCDANSTSVPNMAPFVCTGKSTTIKSLPGVVWVDTGNKAAMDSPLNSRFGENGPFTPPGNPLSCDPANAPADTNVKEYICTRVGGGPNPDNCVNNPSAGSPRDWMEPTNDTTPTSQAIAMTGTKPFNYPSRTSYVVENPTDFSKYGVLWSFSRELNYGTTPPTAYTATDTDWIKLYGGKPQSYPEASPYAQTSGNYFQAPTGVGASNSTEERRVLNLVIIDCAGVVLVPGQACKQTLPVLDIGKFFMQRKANLPGDIVGEFSGLINTPLPIADIRLYR